jgi:histone deacetylase 6
MSALAMPLALTEDSSSCTEDDGLYFDDDALPQEKVYSPSDSYLPTLSAATQVNANAIAALAKSEGDLKTGIVAESGSKHFDRHNRLHKERPLRVTSIMEALKNSPDDLAARCRMLGNTASELAQTFLQDDEDYLRVHLPGYIQRLNKLSGCSCGEKLDGEAHQYKSIFLTKDSTTQAKKAAASLCSLVSDVVRGDLDNGFAVIRPPGHHAEPGLAGGYCLINNIAVAAAYARVKHALPKILIVDWDVHHGNGTQSIFLEDPNVLYFSVHRWQGGNFFPFLSNGGPTNVGKGEGEGFNVNVGWSRKEMGDEEYFAVWERLLMPIAREFNPDLVLVSAGFDAAASDMGECNVTPEAFGHLTRSLQSLANGRVVCTLEGGYVRSVLGKCVQSVVGSLLDRKSPEIYKTIEEEAERQRDGSDILECIDPIAAKDICLTIEAHRPYWKCLRQS